jgi:hypothetical protein
MRRPAPPHAIPIIAGVDKTSPFSVGAGAGVVCTGTRISETPLTCDNTGLDEVLSNVTYALLSSVVANGPVTIKSGENLFASTVLYLTV